MQRSRGVAVALAGVLLLGGCLGQPAGAGAGNADPGRNANATEITLTITANSTLGGKNAVTAAWITDYVIPRFTERQRAKGVSATVRFEGNGAADEDYRTKVALDFTTGGGGDVVEVDGTLLGEFVQANQIASLDEVVGGERVAGWDGWQQIPASVRALGEFAGRRYGVPIGTDGRLLFYNKKLFARAGLPTDWQPRSWDDIIAAGQALKQVPGVTPIQLNAGTAMGEATAMQGVLPLLAGTGVQVNTDGRWQGDTSGIRDVLGFYQRIYAEGLGDPLLQQEAKGRDKSFAEFADNRIGILLESDYFWRSVLEPTSGVAPMADRDQAVGWALIPARNPGSGVNGQDFVSMSGGGVRVINPNTRYPRQAWELLEFMNSAEAIRAWVSQTPQITPRQDVNNEVLAGDPVLSFIASRVLPITAFRPGRPEYPKVSAALQQATADVVAGRGVAEAASAYQRALTDAVGAGNVVGG